MTIRGIGKIRKISKLRDLSSFPRKLRTAKRSGIPLRPRPVDWGKEEDPLEKAAMQDVPGTLPERIVLKWLTDQDYTFTPEAAEMGGQMVLGGAVIDFLVYDMAGQPVALRVQGDYWHGPKFPDRQAKDDDQFRRLTQMGYKVVDLWEHDIYEAVLYDRLTEYIEGEVFA